MKNNTQQTPISPKMAMYKNAMKNKHNQLPQLSEKLQKNQSLAQFQEQQQSQRSEEYRKQDNLRANIVSTQMIYSEGIHMKQISLYGKDALINLIIILNNELIKKYFFYFQKSSYLYQDWITSIVPGFYNIKISYGKIYYIFKILRFEHDSQSYRCHQAQRHSGWKQKGNKVQRQNQQQKNFTSQKHPDYEVLAEQQKDEKKLNFSIQDCKQKFKENVNLDLETPRFFGMP